MITLIVLTERDCVGLYIFRLVGDAWIIDSSSGCCPRVVCSQRKRWASGYSDMLGYRLLPVARAHPSHGWVQKLLYKEPWYIKHPRNHSPPSLPCLALGAAFSLGRLRVPTSQFIHGYFYVHPCFSIYAPKKMINLFGQT